MRGGRGGGRNEDHHVGKLTAKQVENIAEAGKYEDGEGLRLLVDKSGNKRFIFRYQFEGRRREMGLGGYPAVSLKGARDAAAAVRVQLSQRVDPLASRQAAEEAERLERSKSRTFEECAQEYIAAHSPSWKNEKHRQQWRNTLATYAYPTIGEKPVQEVSTADVLAILKPIWLTKAETASRVRNRIELVLDAARAQGLRTGENPAQWRGHLDKLLPKRSQAQAVKHRPAMPWDDVPAFMTLLSGRRSGAARALRFTILTACRSTEVLHATWAEFDLKGRVWTIPGERMKANKPHRVPLTDAMLEVLELQRGHDDTWVFPGWREGRPFSNMAMVKVMRDANLGHFVPHGFRSTFRDWSAECTMFPRDVCEMALAHAIENRVEAAYRRGDLFEKRRALMEAWSDHVVPRLATPAEAQQLAA
ncbi:integrase [Methylobacterium hispanicum]